MTNMESGLQNSSFSQVKGEGELISPVPRDGTWLVPSRVSSKEESSTLQRRTLDEHMAWS